jgi:Ca2+-binding RTX toxin-like protein
MNVRMRWGGAAALASVALALGAVSAGADVEPAGGSNFDAGEDGWQATTASCSFLGGGELLCDASGERVEQGGNPNGALRARSTVTANAGGLFSSQHVFRSATFTLTDPFDGAFTYDRRLDDGQLIGLGVRADVTVVLVNEATGGETVVLTDPLSAERNGDYANRLAGVPAGILQADVPYHLEIRVEMGNTDTPEEVLGSSDVFFDNIRFVTSARGSGGGGNGGGSGGSGSSSGSGGGEGLAPGGSVIKLSRCTILGTPGDDDIVGTNRADIICALGGDDEVRGLSGHDVVDGANGDDEIAGGKKGDVMFGVAGRDSIKGAVGADKLIGGPDRDVLLAGPDNDNISSHDGERDVVDGGSGVRNRARTDAKDDVKRVQRSLG